MVKETRPDKVLVTTVDSTHDSFIIAGMEAGLDVITEKPLTTDETKWEAPCVEASTSERAPPT